MVLGQDTIVSLSRIVTATESWVVWSYLLGTVCGAADKYGADAALQLKAFFSAYIRTFEEQTCELDEVCGMTVLREALSVSRAGVAIIDKDIYVLLVHRKSVQALADATRATKRTILNVTAATFAATPVYSEEIQSIVSSVNNGLEEHADAVIEAMEQLAELHKYPIDEAVTVLVEVAGNTPVWIAAMSEVAANSFRDLLKKAVSHVSAHEAIASGSYEEHAEVVDQFDAMLKLAAAAIPFDDEIDSIQAAIDVMKSARTVASLSSDF